MIYAELINAMGYDRTVVNAARVSFGKQIEEMRDKDYKLLRYLWSHGHESPFRHVQASFRCYAPIFVARQLAKHQISLSWNEISKRYVDTEPKIYYPSRWRAKPDSNIKQGSGDFVADSNQGWTDSDYNEAIQSCLYAYNQMIERGVAPEQARMVLPQSMMTQWIWTGSLQAFAHVCRLRLDSDAQKETRALALDIDTCMGYVAPYSWQLMMGYAE